MKDKEIDLSETPELGSDFFAKAKLLLPKRKEIVSIRLDPDVLEWFRKQGQGYQTRINAILRLYMKEKTSHPG